ncbi:MAG: GNAT family N-acetyltransferase [Vibrio gallaecicus]|uniref:GNAT family N-acetyltransferase n=1 Tax=Vibrio TaxID=662 RepID=UPI0010C9FD4D|nr:GNAT family N-acetyltransferase [Vibrio gallaecicus]MDN3613615.1 GNAT family N-acetyltransferase [Vibrio gallaecicus]MDN3614926.1 GNAT family N-acetyltransferase [Vibrio gallaecicus]
MTIATSRALLVPYTEHLEHDFILLNCCPINRLEMNGPHTLASAKRVFENLITDNQSFTRAIIDNKTREYIGHLFVTQSEGKHELGYIINKEYWNEGLATEVLRPFFTMACFELDLSEVFATVNIDHVPSIKLLEKLGFVQQEAKQDQFGPYYLYQYSAYGSKATTSYGAVAQSA